jgi:glycosyltransferase involved in cell wall biosynthesis
MKPFFSVIIPTYNRSHAIKNAVDSVLKQTFHDFEIIIIDDASTDHTKEVVEVIDDYRVHYILNQTNQERCISRNIGISKAKGEYICFLDSDDYHLPEHLEKLYIFIQSKKEKIAFFFTNAWDETEDGVRTERLCPDLIVNSNFTYFLRYTVNPQRWCVHRDIFEKVKFDPEVIICEDMDTSLRIVSAGYPVYQLNERSTVYVAAADSFTHGDVQKWEKELFYLKRIFSKKELNGNLPLKERNRLLSLCYFHLSNKHFRLKNRWLTIKYSIQSFVLFPKGYNGKTNKIVLVNFLYSIFKKN